MKLKKNLLPLVFLMSLQAFAQAPNYIKDLNAAQKVKLFESKKDTKKQHDGLTERGYAVEDNDKIFYIDQQGFPTTLKGKYIYWVTGQEIKNKRTGVFKFYAIDAKNTDQQTLVKEMTFTNDTLNGEFKYYYADGSMAQKGTYKNGIVDGLTIIYYPDQTKHSEFSYTNGKINGVRNDYYKNGQLKLMMEIKDSKPDGVYRQYYTDGKLQEEWHYVLGKAEGKYQYYHENGQLWVEKEFKNNLLWNIISNFDATGKALEKGTLKDGNGSVISYDGDGKAYIIEHFTNGVKVNEEQP